MPVPTKPHACRTTSGVRMRLQLANSLGNRDGTTDKDERILNGLVESEGGRRKGDKSRVLKRPSCVSTFVLTTGLGGRGQALFVRTLPGAPGIPGTATLVGIRGDTLTTPVT